MNAAWDRAFPNCMHDAAGRRTPQRMRFGLTALTTPPWAQDIGHAPDAAAITTLLRSAVEPLVVLDLPAPMATPELPTGTWALERHTRQSVLQANEDPVDAWPSTRRKQLRRAEREGMTVSKADDLSLMVTLHQAARARKGLKSDGKALRTLLGELLLEPDTHAWVVRNSSGNAWQVACSTETEAIGASMDSEVNSERKCGRAVELCASDRHGDAACGPTGIHHL